MSQNLSIAAEPRDRAGKGVARATRRNNRVPGVIYGGKEPPVLIQVEDRELSKHAHGAGFFTHVFELKLDGATHRVLARDLQLHPLTDRPTHVDFLRVSSDTMIRIDIPVKFVNELQSPGLKRGGTLNIVRHEIEFLCKVDSIPEFITVDLSGVDIGDSIHISHVKLPDGIKATTDRDFTVATVAAPSALRGKEEEADAAASAAASAAAAPAAAAPAAAAKPAAAPKK
jgi:large subunit ribosomal protein L25